MIWSAAVVLGCSGEVQPPSRPWNVLMIVPDTVRADHVSVNGYERKTTPHLDALAAEGTNFSHAVTAAPRTWQSFTSILTGRYPPNHGVRFIFDNALSPDIPTLGTLFGQAGYETRVFDQLPFVRQMVGGVGFQEFDDVVRSESLVMANAWSWISSADRSRPFFAFVRTVGAHWPYRASPADLADFDPCDGRDHSFNEGNFGTSGLKMGPRGQGVLIAKRSPYWHRYYDVNVGERELRHRIAHYDATLRNVDALIGELLGQMRRTGLLERTIVAVSSDHGESMGEAGYFQHGPQLDESVLLVPMIVRLPKGHPALSPGWEYRVMSWLGLKPALRGRTIDGLVRTVDLFPTILDAAGLPIPADIDGVSLLPAISGGELPELWAYAENGRSYVGVDPDRYVAGVEGKMRMIRDSRWKLIFVPKPQGGEYRLYDLSDGTVDAVDVAAEHPETVERMRRLLQSVVLGKDERSGPEKALTDAEKEQLRNLGYM